jgi:hypothetical protein
VIHTLDDKLFLDTEQTNYCCFMRVDSAKKLTYLAEFDWQASDQLGRWFEDDDALDRALNAEYLFCLSNVFLFCILISPVEIMLLDLF